MSIIKETDPGIILVKKVHINVVGVRGTKIVKFLCKTKIRPTRLLSSCLDSKNWRIIEIVYIVFGDHVLFFNSFYLICMSCKYVGETPIILSMQVETVKKTKWLRIDFVSKG